MTEPECTCTFKPPRHTGWTWKPYSYVYYLDEWEDDSEIDPACPYHGDNGTMVVTIRVPSVG
jgi:hypothetical protein